MTQKSTRSGRKQGTTPTPKRRRGRPTRQETKEREAAYAQFEGERVIHRYGNRRFYDLESRRAVTLDEIETMVRTGENVRVLDVDNGNEDITRRVLTLDHPRGQEPQQPRDAARRVLAQADLDAGQKTATWLDGYLKAGAALLDRSVREGMELSTTYHKQLSEIMQGAMPRSWGTSPKRPEPAPTASRSEIDELRRRLDELAKDAAAKGR